MTDSEAGQIVDLVEACWPLSSSLFYSPEELKRAIIDLHLRDVEYGVRLLVRDYAAPPALKLIRDASNPEYRKAWERWQGELN